MTTDRPAPVDEADEPTALYRIFSSDESLLYVGISNRPRTRLKEHSHRQAWWPEVDFQTVAWYPTREKADDAETMAIALEGPRYNIAKRYEPVRGIPFSLDEPQRPASGDTLPAQVEDAIEYALNSVRSEPDGEKATRRASELATILRSQMIKMNEVRSQRASELAGSRGLPIAVMSEVLGVSKARAASIIGDGLSASGKPRTRRRSDQEARAFRH
jgi:predicted GIY-YIG superfamily endonuclease